MTIGSLGSCALAVASIALAADGPAPHSDNRSTLNGAPEALAAALTTSPMAQQVTAPANGSPVTAPQSDDLASAIARGVELLLAMQEGEAKQEWPYEGVYRVRGQIPIGYRIGGTAIAGMALLAAPSLEADAALQAAIERAAEFITSGCDHELMSPDYDGGYDVRGWGYTYGLMFLLALKAHEAVPPSMGDAAERSIQFYLNAIQHTEIPQSGGWNYARAQGIDRASPSSPFMTAPTLQALFTARSMGYEVDAEIVERALKALENARTETGAFAYSGVNPRESVPGSVGRMLAAECTLQLAGRSSIDRVRASIDAFIVHWDWLEKRRRQQGTHVAPYGIAPYYFYYAHYYAAQAIELLPQAERDEYRRRLHELLFRTRAENGSWNDRVFDRSANFGTAMAILALHMPEAPKPAAWKASTAAAVAEPGADRSAPPPTGATTPARP